MAGSSPIRGSSLLPNGFGDTIYAANVRTFEYRDIERNRAILIVIAPISDVHKLADATGNISPADYMVTLAWMIAGDGAKPPVAEELLSAMEPTGAAN